MYIFIAEPIVRHIGNRRDFERVCRRETHVGNSGAGKYVPVGESVVFSGEIIFTNKWIFLPARPGLSDYATCGAPELENLSARQYSAVATPEAGHNQFASHYG